MSRDFSTFQIFKLRLLYFATPAALITCVLWYAILGEQGLFRYHMLQHNLNEVRHDTSSVEKENEALRNLIQQYRNNPRKIRQAAAELLLHTEDKSQIFRFPE